MTKEWPGNLHIIAAKEAPVAVIIRRKPSKVFHIMKWDLLTDEITHGSWFNGKIYEKRCDISWDGKYMAYFAMGSDGDVWNGICELPFLKTVVQWRHTSAWNGGGVWMKRDVVYRNLLIASEPEVLGDWPADVTFADLVGSGGEDIPIVFCRLYRDGFRPVLDGKRIDPLDSEFRWTTERVFDKIPWRLSPTPAHPALFATYVGYKQRGKNWYQDGLGSAAPYENRTGYIFRFELEGFPDLLGPRVNWATWTSAGELLYSIEETAYRQTLDGIIHGLASKAIDFSHLARPIRAKA